MEEEAEREGVDPFEYEFTRRKVRTWLRISNDQAKRTLKTLVDFEYLWVASRGKAGTHRYRLGEADAAEAVFEKMTSPEKLHEI